MKGLVIGEGVEMMGDIVLHDLGDVDVLGLNGHGYLQTKCGTAEVLANPGGHSSGEGATA
jgi:hypothetical protein